jgi:hypothetical protein
MMYFAMTCHHNASDAILRTLFGLELEGVL